MSAAATTDQAKRLATLKAELAAVATHMPQEFFEALRDREVKPDQILYALTMASHACLPSDSILLGYCQEIYKALGTQP